MEPRIVPLTDHGAAAFAAFHAAKAYGTFHSGGVNDCVKTAAASIGIAKGTLTLYHLRHSFLTEVMRRTKNTDTVARFGMHAEGSVMPLMYAAAALEDVDAAAVDALNGANPLPTPPAAPPVQVPPNHLPRKVATRHNLRLVS